MGEHAVVYGKPAIVAAVNRRMTVVLKKKNGDLEISAKSEIPVGVGLGSSAALAVVQAAALVAIQATTVDRIETKLPLINEVAYEIEKINHGHPSGVDNTVCTYGGILWFQRKDGRAVFKRLAIKDLPEFILINTGKPKETTGEMVEYVKTQMSNVKTKSKILKLFEEIERQTKIFLQVLPRSPLRALPLAEQSDLIKNCLKNCELCLEDLGVVGEKAKRVIREIERIGGAAKISGAGGTTGGSGILLGYHQDPEKITNLAKKLKLETIRVKLGGEGLAVKGSLQ